VQKSITQQFIRLKYPGLMYKFPTDNTGLDPVMGQEHIPKESIKGQNDGQNWSRGWDENSWMRYEFSDCVQMKAVNISLLPALAS